MHIYAVMRCIPAFNHVRGVVSEQTSVRSFGMRNFKYVNTIKAAVEKECPLTVSCADIVALSARDGIAMVCLCHHIHMLGVASWRASHSETYMLNDYPFIPLNRTFFFKLGRLIWT